MRTKVVSFFIFSESFQTKKIKALRPKMTKIASGGPALTIKALSLLSSMKTPVEVCSMRQASLLLLGFLRADEEKSLEGS